MLTRFVQIYEKGHKFSKRDAKHYFDKLRAKHNDDEYVSKVQEKFTESLEETRHIARKLINHLHTVKDSKI